MSEFFPSRSPSPTPIVPKFTPEELKTHLERLWATVMADLLLATHCHACGIATPVALTGYTGTHCSKFCWRVNELEACSDFECAWGGCVICDGGFVSLARSTRHRDPLVGWPMVHHRPCTNVTIATRRPVHVCE